MKNAFIVCILFAGSAASVFFSGGGLSGAIFVLIGLSVHVILNRIDDLKSKLDENK